MTPPATTLVRADELPYMFEILRTCDDGVRPWSAMANTRRDGRVFVSFLGYGITLEPWQRVRICT